MKKLALLGLATCTLSAFTACGGAQQTALPRSASQPTVVPSGYVVPQFTIRIPNDEGKTQAFGATRIPQFVSPSTLSVNITLNTVDGSSPPNGLPTSVTTNVSSGSCSSGCTVNGPAVPPGTDSFTVTAYNAPNASGSQLSAYTQSFTVTAGQANSLAITLRGVPATFTIVGVPSASAGTAFVSASALTLTVMDASGNAITGTYANPVTFRTTDTSSLAEASGLTVNAGSTAASVTVNASTDTLGLKYGGQAIAASTLTASASGATNATTSFAPTLSPITASPTQINLYAASGTGSSGTVAVSETGWSGSPYNQNFTVSVPGNCSNIATMTGNLTSTTGTTFTVSAVGSPAAGTCIATLIDGAGQTQSVTLTYTTTNLGINAAKRGE